MATAQMQLDLAVTHHVLRPGDTVLLALNMSATAEHADMLLGRLREVFPGVQFCVIDNVTAVLVQAAP